jgi:AraC-like DNA-binding protein
MAGGVMVTGAHKKNRRMSLFTKILLSFLLIDSIFLTCVIMLYQTNLRTARRVIDANVGSAMESGLQYMENVVLTSEAMAVRLASDSDLRMLTARKAYCTEDYPYAYDLLNTYRSLTLSVQHQGISDAILILRNGIVFSGGRFFTDLKSFYGDFFSYGEWSGEEWLAKLEECEQFWPVGEAFFFGSQPGRYILYNCIMPLDLQSVHVVFVLPESQFLSFLLPGIDTDGIGITIHSANDTLLYDKPLESGNVGQILSFYSNRLNLHYTLSVEQSLYTNNVASILHYMQMVLPAIIIFEGVLLIVLLVWSTRPLHELSHAIEEYIGEKTGLIHKEFPIDCAIRAISHLSTMQTNLRGELSGLEGTLRSTELKYLVSAAHSDVTFVPKLLELVPPMRILIYAVLDGSALGDLCEQLLQLYPGVKGSCVLSRQIVLLYSEAETPINRQRLEEVLRGFNTRMETRIRCAISNAFTKTAHARRAYLEADYTLFKSDDAESCTALYAECVPEEAAPPLTLRYYQSLDVSLSVGNIQEMERFFITLKDDLRKNSLYAMEYQQVLQMIHMYIVTYLHNPAEENESLLLQSGEARDATTFDEMLEALRQQALHIANANHKKEEEKPSAFCADILSFLRLHFNNPDMSLTMLSSRFGTSTKYVSDLIRQQCGKNYMDYLQELRMESTRRMLLDEKCSLQKIAIDVGYLSTNTFYKCFKRYYGMSPSDYRIFCMAKAARGESSAQPGRWNKTSR